MTQPTNQLDIEIADIDARIAQLTNRRNVLAEVRVERFGPFDGKTYPVVESMAAKPVEADSYRAPVSVKAAPKKLTKRPPSMAKLAMTCLRKVGEKGAKRDAIRTYATMVRGDVKAESFSSILQGLRKDGKIILVDHRYYIKGKAPAQPEA